MKVLFTSVCRPLGDNYGDGPSVGYELLFKQVTRAQGIFSPRALHLHFALEYIAENLEAPATVLQYPSRRELIQELKKGYDYVGVSFLLAVFHKMKEVVELIRHYSPYSKIVLGGYGTVLKDEVLLPYADYICREEGVAFFRRLLGEPALPMPYKHPMVVSRLKLFSLPVSNTGMVFAGLGCANGCDFCCTSHFFGRRHIKLLPEGKDIYAVIERYLDIDPNMSFTILDEDFLLNKRRAMEFRNCVLRSGRSLSIFAFSSLRALSQYRVEEILEMGIDGFWIGYEGTRSGYAKQKGRPAADIFNEFREHGITILASMIVGFDYQDRVVVAQELEGLLSLKPCLSQFLIYGPTPGTPFYERIMKEDLLHDTLVADPERYYHQCEGFSSMVKHPRLSATEIESIQRWCFAEDFRRLGPSIYRVIERWWLGYQKLNGSPNAALARKAERLAADIRNAYPVFLAGRLLGPTADVRRWIGALEEDIHLEFGQPTASERIFSLAAVLTAGWTWLKLRLNLFQHPPLTRTEYRVPGREWGSFRIWEAVAAKLAAPGFSVQVEFQHAKQAVWLRLEGIAASSQVEGFLERFQEALSKSKSRVILDLKKLKWEGEGRLSFSIKRKLALHRRRVRVIVPRLAELHPELLLLVKIFGNYSCWEKFKSEQFKD